MRPVYIFDQCQIQSLGRMSVGFTWCDGDVEQTECPEGPQRTRRLRWFKLRRERSPHDRKRSAQSHGNPEMAAQ